MNEKISPDYFKHLQALLAPRTTLREAGATSGRLYEPFLAESQDVRAALATALSEAETAQARSRVEVQLLAAAAADLAVADALLSGPEARFRGQDDDTVSLIQTALTDPDVLLRPTIPPVHYRGADRDLLAAVHQTLNSIQESAIETTADAITAALTMNMAVLRDAAKLAGLDVKQVLEDLGAEEVVVFVIEAWQKMSALIGEDNVEKVQEAVGETIEKLREKTAVAGYVERFLDTESIYKESRKLVQHYDGPDKDLARLTPQILALEGSFAGRNKLVATLIRLLSLAKLAKVLRTPPWGPLIVASGYLLLIGYELYSAHDHVDSDRYPFFDRVAGVRTLIVSIANG